MLETVDWESRASGDPRPGEGARTNRDAQDRHLLSAAGPVALLPCETSLPSDPETLPHQGGRRDRQLRLRHHLGRPAAGRRRPVAGVEPRPLEHREPQPLPPRHGLRRRPEPDSYPSWAGQQRHHLQRRARDRPPRRIRQRAGIDRPLQQPGRPRWRRSSPTEPGERDRAGPAGPMPALHWACKARTWVQAPPNHSNQPAETLPVSPSWPKMVS